MGEKTADTAAPCLNSSEDRDTFSSLCALFPSSRLSNHPPNFNPHRLQRLNHHLNLRLLRAILKIAPPSFPAPPPLPPRQRARCWTPYKQPVCQSSAEPVCSAMSVPPTPTPQLRGRRMTAPSWPVYYTSSTAADCAARPARLRITSALSSGLHWRALGERAA